MSKFVDPYAPKTTPELEMLWSRILRHRVQMFVKIENVRRFEWWEYGTKVRMVVLEGTSKTCVGRITVKPDHTSREKLLSMTDADIRALNHVMVCNAQIEEVRLRKNKEAITGAYPVQVSGDLVLGDEKILSMMK
jgi:hypothetical protein